MIERYDSPIIDVVTRIHVPIIRVFGFYVVAHGHYSPGGGFQGGVILAVSVILTRLALGREESYRRFAPRTGLWLAAAGVLVFLAMALLPLLFGGALLDYGRIPVPGLEEPLRRYWSILIVEAGIGVAVWGALVAIFDKLTGSEL